MCTYVFFLIYNLDFYPVLIDLGVILFVFLL